VGVYRTRDLARLGTVSVGTAGPRLGLSETTPAVFAPDGRTLVVGDRLGRVRFFDSSSLRPLGPPIQVASFAIGVLAYSPRGNSVIATTGYEAANSVHLIDVATRATHLLEPDIQNPIFPTFSPDGQWLLVTSVYGGAVEYPVVDGVPGPGRVVADLLPRALTAEFSPDGRLLATGTEQGTVSLYDAETLHPVATPIPVFSQLDIGVRFSPDGHLLVTEDSVDNIRIVDVSRHAVLGAALVGNGPNDLSFSPDGRTLVLPGPTGSVLADLDITTWLARACDRAGRDLTPTEITQNFASAPEAYACRPQR
jgi:WD40 repeat protein